MAEQKSKEAVSKSGMGAISGTVASSGTSQSRIRRLQSYLLIWADGNFDDTKKDCQNTLKHLRSVVNEVHVLATPMQCITFLNEMDKQKAFVISSGALGLELVPEIHDIPRVDTIYIFCGNKQRYTEWAKDWSKVQGVHTEIKPICELLKKVTRELDHDAISMSIVPNQMVASDGGKPKLDQLEPSFMYTVLFKEIVLEIVEDDSKAMRQLVDYCREKGTVEHQLKYFESTYHQKTPIWWYTCEIFLYGMLNHALRSLEMETMAKLGFVIRNLHQQLDQLHRKQLNDFEKNFVVYRGQGLNKEDFQRLANNKSGLLSFNSFLSTSKKKEVSMDFIQRNLVKNPENVGVLFTMTIDSQKVSISSSTPFALIDHESAIPKEKEILFSMHTVFRIEDIQQMEEKKRIHEVKLTLTDDNDPQLSELTQRMRKELEGVGWHRMGILMLKVGDFNGAEQLYMELLKNTDNERTRSVYFNQLGRAKNNQGEYEEAVKYYEKSIEINERILDKSDPALATSYNNIALAYNDMGDYSKALEYYEKSIEIDERTLDKNDPNLATSYNNIALVYNNMDEYLKALEYYKKSIEIRKISLPKNHPGLATTYSNIGQVYNNMGEYSKALECYEKSHKIFEIALPKNHPELATSYNNIASVYYNMKKYSKALELFERALEIQREKLPSAHPHIADTKEWIQDVKQKL